MGELFLQTQLPRQSQGCFALGHGPRRITHAIPVGQHHIPVDAGFGRTITQVASQLQSLLREGE